jgi:hypothetical protein
MKHLYLAVLVFTASGAFAADCVTTVTGRTICKDGTTAAAVNPATGTAATAQKYPSGVTTAATNTGAKAAYNPHTGNAAVQQTNANGSKTTQTSRGGQATTKNGMGVAETPNGTKCYRGAATAGCKP